MDAGDTTTTVPDGSQSQDGGSLRDTSPPPADVVPDRGPSDGIRCGEQFFCGNSTPECCVFDDGGTGSASYQCTASLTDCNNNGGYGIACASDNDCNGSDICCIFSSGIKCDSEGASACNGKTICDPDGSTDQCSTGQKCTGTATLPADGVPIAYSVCQ